MKTLILSALIVCVSATLQAKKTNDVKVLLEGPSYFMPCPQMDMDKNAKNSTVKWRSTEDRHVEGRDGAWVKNVPVRTIKPFNDKKFSLDYEKNDGLVHFTFQLTEEGKYTVLHCYMAMPAASVTNFWLASDETAIVDRETGAHYRAIRCEPAEAWYKYFNFTAPKDSMIDFKIYFPRLLPSTRVVSIYGVPNWGLRGEMEWVIGKDKQDMAIGYDQVPEIHHPTLVRPANNYNKNNSNSWAVYTEAHLIKPLKEGTKAIWITPEATYVAVAHEQNWLREYMGVEKGGMLLDGNGHQYKLKGLVDYPLGEIYWVEGYSGDFLATFKVFEPLPLGIETITYVEPDGEPFSAWGANWKGSVESNLSVEELRFNQRFFEYKKRDIIIQ